MSAVCKLVQPSNAETPMLVHWLRLYTALRFEQPTKHPIGRDTPDFILMLVNPVQYSNAEFPIVDAFEMSVFLNPRQPLKAALPIETHVFKL